ncbi:collectin-10-like [Physella acuta]|uniref:collectin-10-like n=1 Tax=Physella acuta TaxID=109671 RepID=UPI0027DBA836|nr:collectin-10-like [Physella acuta]
MSDGTTVTYVWLSNYKLNFTSARDDCRAKGAHLYTPKTQEKLDLFISISRPLNTNIWIGMNDIATAYEFIWDDDGSIYTGMPNVFIKGDPNNLNNRQRCVCTIPGQILMADVECYITALFVCEFNATLYF